MQSWRDDGHALRLLVRDGTLTATGVDCPEAGGCHNGRVGCIVRWSVALYGTDLLNGTAEPAAVMPVAWTIVGDLEEDPDVTQVWLIPTTDDSFAAWRATQVE